jgi:putative transposase
MYNVRKLKIDQTEQLDVLATASGELYSRTLVSFWRTVRKHGLWLKPSSMMRWQNSGELHAHSADAVVQSFYASLKSWRALRKVDPDAKPPKRRKHFFKVQWKNSAIRLKDGCLVLSNGKGNEPLIIPWNWTLPTLVELGWNGTGYELRVIYSTTPTGVPLGVKVAGVDMGEIHLAVTHDGDDCHIYNGRYLRSVKRYQNKKKAEISARLDRMKKGSRRSKYLKHNKARTLKKLDNQINDILHKQTTKLVSTLHEAGVKTVVIGDVRDIRKGLDYGAKANQKIHQWHLGKTRWLVSYKAERLGMEVVLQDEAYTSQTCPACGKRHKPKDRNYRCSCGFQYHRDGIGAYNIRAKYLGELETPHVVGAMMSPTGVRVLQRCSHLARKNPLPLGMG